MLAVGLVPGAASAAQTAHGQATRSSEASASAPKAAARAVLAERAAAAAGVSHSAAITGTVLGPGGRPLLGACVAATGPAGVVTKTVPVSGQFVLTGLAPGSYTLAYWDCAAPGEYHAAWSGGASSQASARHIVLTPGHIGLAGSVTLYPMSQTGASPDLLTTREQAPPSAADWRNMLANSSGSLSGRAAAKTGQLRGLVTGNGKPLRDICVEAIGGNHYYAAKTGANGRYEVSHMAPGRYSVYFSGPNCGRDGDWLRQTYPDITKLYAVGKQVTIAAGKTTSGINARLRLGAQISGKVTSPAGKPLGNVCIEASAPVFFYAAARTKANGTYHLTALFPAKYTVAFNIYCGTNKYAPQWYKNANSAKKASRIRAGYGQRITGINAALIVGGTISGTVRQVHTSGPGIRGMCITAASNTIYENTSTGAGGKYRLIGLSTGLYQLYIQPSCGTKGSYVATSTQTRARLGKASTFNILVEPGAVMTGKVTGAHGNPVAGVCLSLNSPSGFPGFFRFGTRPSGSYFISDLAKGSYIVGFEGGCGNSGSYGQLWYNNEPTAYQADPIALTTGEHVTLTAQKLPSGATIKGEVTGPAGRKLSGICVGAEPVALSRLEYFYPYYLTFTRDGSYDLENVLPGQYAVNINCFGSPAYASRWFNNAPTAGSADEVSAGAGETVVIDQGLPRAGAISGIVTGPDGRRLANACISVVSNRDRPSEPLLTGARVQAITNSHGGYHIGGLAPGGYYVAIGSCQSKYGQQWYGGKSAKASATVVDVRAGRDTSSIDGRLALGGSVSGRVVDAKGKPQPYVCVLAENSTTDWSGLVYTSNSGRYTMGGLDTGRYTLYITQCNLLATLSLVPVVKSVAIIAPKARSGVNATLGAGGAVAGVVKAGTPTPKPVSDICVDIDSSNPLNFGGYAFTDQAGHFHAEGIAPGTYTVEFNGPVCKALSYFIFSGYTNLAPQWFSNQPTQATAAHITVTRGVTTSGVNADLQPDGTITGTVTGPAAVRVSGECVTAVPLATDSAPITAISRAGGYSLVDLMTGQYKVEFSSGCGATGYITQWWQNASSVHTATILTVNAGETISGINASLTK